MHFRKIVSNYDFPFSFLACKTEIYSFYAFILILLIFQHHGWKNWPFEWNNCRKSDPMQITKFSLTPDPLKAGSTADIFFSMDVANDIAAPIKMNISIKVEVPGGKWVEVCILIPYLDEKCTLKDLCQTLRQIQTCPPILTKQGFDCTCPIKKGTYGTPQKIEFKIPDSLPTETYNTYYDMFLMSIRGNFKVNLEFSKTSDNGPVGCLDVKMKLVN